MCVPSSNPNATLDWEALGVSGVQLRPRYLKEDGAKSPGHAKRRFRIMTLQQKALRAPIRGSFEGFRGFDPTFKRIV